VDFGGLKQLDLQWRYLSCRNISQATSILVLLITNSSTQQGIAPIELRYVFLSVAELEKAIADFITDRHLPRSSASAQCRASPELTALM